MQEGMASTMASCKTTWRAQNCLGRKLSSLGQIRDTTSPKYPPLLHCLFSQTSALLRLWKKAMAKRLPHVAALSFGGFTTRWSVELQRSLVHRLMRSPKLITKPFSWLRRNVALRWSAKHRVRWSIPFPEALLLVYQIYSLSPTKKNRVVPSSNWSWPLWWKDTSELAICKENFEGPLPDFQCFFLMDFCWNTVTKKSQQGTCIGIKSKGGSWGHQGFSHCHSRNPVERDPSFWAAHLLTLGQASTNGTSCQLTFSTSLETCSPGPPETGRMEWLHAETIRY